MPLVLLKLVHVIAAIVAVGANVTYAYWLRAGGRDRDRLRFAIGAVHDLDRRVTLPGYIVVLLTGFAMVATGFYNFGAPKSGWLGIALLLYVVTAVIGFHDFAPALRNQAVEAETDPSSPAYAAAASRTQRLSYLTMGFVAVIVFLMVVKPF